jgi:hypothetical protein
VRHDGPDGREDEMIHRFRRVAVLAGLAALAGCSAHNPLIVGHTTQVKPVSRETYAAHEARVLVTEATLAPEVEYEVVARIDVGRAWYGRSLTVHEQLARRARALGADAVVEVETWFQPSGYSWWAPHGRGKAVKIVSGITPEQLAELGPML